MTLQELLAKRARVWDEMQALRKDGKRDENGALIPEEREKWDRCEAEMASLTTEIDNERSFQEHQRQMDAVVTDSIVNPGKDQRTSQPEDESANAYRSAFLDYIVRGMSSIAPEKRQLLQANFVPGDSRAAGIGAPAAGGYLVPPTFRATLIEQLKAYGAVREVSTVVETASGAPIQWPTNDDTGNVGAILAENTQVGEQDLVFNTATLGAFMYTSKLVRASLQFLQDVPTEFAESFLARALGQRIARAQNQHFTTGTGIAQPTGVVTGAAVGVTGANGTTTSLGADAKASYGNILSLIYSVDPAVLGSGNCRWMLGVGALSALRALTDAQNRPLWEPSVQAAAPDTLLGYPVVLNPDMPVMAASAKSVLFGDFQRAYVIRDVSGFQLLRLDERYADYLQVGFLGFQRSDATTQDVNAVKAYRNSAT